MWGLWNVRNDCGVWKMSKIVISIIYEAEGGRKEAAPLDRLPHSELSMYSHNILRQFKWKLLLLLLFFAFPVSTQPQMGQECMESFIKILLLFGRGARFQVILRRTFFAFQVESRTQNELRIASALIGQRYAWNAANWNALSNRYKSDIIQN